MYTTTWAIDDGYGDLKGFNGVHSLLVPSFCTRWRPLQSTELGPINRDPYSHISVEIDGTKYLIGRGALEQDTRLNWAGGENKHLDQYFPILLGGCLSLLSGGVSDITLSPLVMGLPVKVDDDEGRHRLLRDIVIGKREVITTLANGYRSKVRITVNELICKKQPFGSFCDVILDKSGNLIDRQIAGQFNVIVDIGARTLNIYTLDALQPIYDLGDTTNDGVYSVYTWIKQYIESQLGQQIPEGRIPYIISRGEIRGMPLKEVLNECYSTLANNITSKLETMLIDSWVLVDKIIFTGGGSEVLQPWLKKNFISKPTLFLDRFSTARGLYKYGVRYAKKNNIDIKQGEGKETIMG